MKHQLTVVLNLGGSKALTVAKRIRECGVYSEVYPYTLGKEELEALNPHGILVTGSCDNVHAAAMEKIPWLNEIGCPTLEVGSGTPLSIEALAGGVGKKCLDNFLKITCNCTGDWSLQGFADGVIENYKKAIGDRNIAVGVTGGIDSAVTAALLAKAVGPQCTAIFIDTGLLRQNEPEQTVEMMETLDLNFVKVNAETKFMFKLLGIDDPIRKKSIIDNEYAAILEAEAAKADCDCLALSTIYTDLLVNHTLPFSWQPKETFEPLKYLFKDEVVQLATLLGLPQTVLSRNSFPLYGLATRCIGAITMERLDIVRQADAIFCEEIEKAKLDKHMNQYFASITNFKSAAIRGNRQTYEYTLILRAAFTNDYISADWATIPDDILRNISRRITTEIGGVSRILLDITSTPPAAIELE
ncbi:MAG: GMP synthase (glutamine-hydrolyzing) [Clostridia bacterium]|nr:GMP synthase (glutamine-hydrolyzing) [Clostridia bacterium]